MKRACEDVISYCANPVCDPLRTWRERIDAYNASRKELPAELTSQPWAQQPGAEELDRSFRASCERDLRGNVARMRLYLEDDRTVGVLVEHVQDRIMDEYVAFKDVVWNMYAGGLRGTVLTTVELRALLRTVCDSGEEHVASSS